MSMATPPGLTYEQAKRLYARFSNSELVDFLMVVGIHLSHGVTNNYLVQLDAIADLLNERNENE